MSLAFESGNIQINNEDTPQKCGYCHLDISPHSVHQPDGLQCQETKIHIHRWLFGKCPYPGCLSIIKEKSKGFWGTGWNFIEWCIFIKKGDEEKAKEFYKENWRLLWK